MTRASKTKETPLRTEQHRPPADNAYVVPAGEVSESATLTCTVVHALADATGLSMHRAWYLVDTHVDRASLDAIFRPKASGEDRVGAHVAFDLADPAVRVVAMACGSVRIEPLGGGR